MTQVWTEKSIENTTHFKDQWVASFDFYALGDKRGF